MRIVAGEWRGRSIRPPKDARVRPTSDKVREAWMSIVRETIPDALVLDLFAGSGALGLEALSRGAARCDFVEVSQPSLRAVRENVEALGAGDRAVVHRGDVLRFIAGLEADAYDLAFADPPYGHGLAAKVAERWLEVPFAGVLGIEHSIRDAMPEGGDLRRYGTTAISFYRR